jgi:hypothetical protein
MDGYAAKLCTRIPGLNGLLPGIGTPPGKSAIRWREFVEQVRVPLPTAQITGVDGFTNPRPVGVRRRIAASRRRRQASAG